LSSQAIPARVTFISHAATVAVRRAAFPLDEPLVEGEIEKIAGIGWSMPRVQYILSGPEQRTKQTAEGLGLKATVAMELMDVNYGVWRGKGIEEIQESDPQGLTAWLTDLEATPHGGDSFAQLIERIGHWMKSRTKAGHTLAVTHPAVVRSAGFCAVVLAHRYRASLQNRSPIRPRTLDDPFDGMRSLSS
jgi:broad specificity phosphatase PhoE